MLPRFGFRALLARNLDSPPSSYSWTVVILLSGLLAYAAGIVEGR